MTSLRWSQSKGLLVVVLLVSGCATTEGTYRRAGQYLSAGNYEAAVVAYEAYLQKEGIRNRESAVQEKKEAEAAHANWKKERRAVLTERIRDLAKTVALQPFTRDCLEPVIYDPQLGRKYKANNDSLRYVSNESEGGGHWWVRFEEVRDDIFWSAGSYGLLFRWQCSWESDDRKTDMVTVTLHVETYETAGDWSEEGGDVAQLKSLGSGSDRFLAKEISGGKTWKFVKWLPKNL